MKSDFWLDQFPLWGLFLFTVIVVLLSIGVGTFMGGRRRRKTDRGSVIHALFVSSLNDMLDLHNSRVTVFRYRIPPVIWYALYFITILSMITVGYHTGLSGKSSLKVGLVLALTFSAVLWLIADLDRTAEGYLRVSQRSMFELQKRCKHRRSKQSQKQNFRFRRTKSYA